MNIKKFEEFIKTGVVKKQSPNRQRALHLLEEVKDKKQFLNKALKTMPPKDVYTNFIIDSCYDIIMESIRAKMFTDGYNPGNSHQAEVSYLRNLGFLEPHIIFMDELRYNRNGIKYYGTIFDREYADNVLDFMERIYPKLIVNIPTREECIKILKENNVTDNIIAHLKAVCEFSMKVVDVLEKKGINVNRELVAAGALLHDIKKLAPGNHVIVGYEFVKSLGYPEVALIVKKHGLADLKNDDCVPKTWEEKIVFYSDKRVKNDRVVSADERFEYIKQKYNKADVEIELKFTKEIEKELLGNEKILN